MATDNSATLPQDGSATAAAEQPLKGKGKSTAEEPVDTTMDEDDDDDDDEEEEVCYLILQPYHRI